ncbi:hypothetical protein K2173_023897 [Erythroxylum novogranatense]|uniref:MADS-box domain-containing protein n=1 Tax=Erythroxylum novogranatense TaxID=1862640 RepID=A0AAV8TPV3_9ROSI|nr:hypothetical protein K2173_023897 [Erythroxylum novogranatense]
MPRTSKGRQKLSMVKIENESNRQVTFSKRRAGLFKKASELSTLCGAESAIIVFSPGKKVFSYGHPSVEAIFDRYLTGNIPPTSGTFQLIEAHRHVRVHELNLKLTQVLNQLEAEKKQGEELDKIRRASQNQCWWEQPIDTLDRTQLELMKVSLEELRNKVANQAEKLLFQTSNPSQILPSTSTIKAPPFDSKYNGFNTNTKPYGYNHGFGSGFC